MEGLYGRADVLARARRGVEHALAGGGRLLLFTGEPGIGKSRLAEQVAAEAPHLGPAVARGIAASYFWLADHADTPLLMGTDGQLQDELSRPATSLARWARAQVWPALTAKSA